MTKFHDLLGLLGTSDPVRDAVIRRAPAFGADGFMAYIAYLQGCTASPNGHLFDHIWMAERWSRFFATAPVAVADPVAVQLLRINGLRIYHHNIKDFKRIMSILKPDYRSTLAYLASYRVKELQGCYEAISMILAYPLAGAGMAFEALQVKGRIIAWLDNASGRAPKQPWLDKLAELNGRATPTDLQAICSWIIEHKELKRHAGTGWIDDVYTTFQKSAQWYLAGDQPQG